MMSRDETTIATVEPVDREQVKAQVQRERALSKLGRDNRAAELSARRAEELARAEHAAKLEALAEQRKASRKDRRAARWRRARHKLLTLTPLVMVNAAAVYGQISYFSEAVPPEHWTPVAALTLGILLAGAVESIALYVGWHAHDALLLKHYATASRLRRASYLIALLVAGINYSHFVPALDQPTAAGFVFGGLSLLSPWLWGLHTRREQQVQLAKEGLADNQGAVFSPARWRNFPLRTWGARRWSIDYAVTEPRKAWAGYHAARAGRGKHRGQAPAVEAPRVPEPRPELEAAEPVSAGGSLESKTKIEAIREVAAELGSWRAAQIMSELQNRGVEVSESLIYKAKRRAGGDLAAWDTGEMPVISANGESH